MLDPQLVANYRWHRAGLASGVLPPKSKHGLADAYEVACRHARAVLCLNAAVRDLDAGTKRYWSRPFSDRSNGLWAVKGESDRMQWVDNPGAIGLRFFAYADKLDKSIDHEGWWTDDDGHRGTIRGVIYQLPARAGALQFVVGYEEGEEDKALAIDWTNVYRVARRDACDPWMRPIDSYEVSKLARQADKLAERQADEERDYNRAHEAGAAWAEIGEEIKAAKADFRQLLADGVECIREAAEEFVHSIRDLIDARRKLARGDYDGERGYLGFYDGDRELRLAFNDGANSRVLA